MTTLEQFVEKIVAKEEEKILSILLLGSHKGKDRIDISDIDIFILCKRKSDVATIFDEAATLAEQTFNVSYSRVTRWIQRHLFASNHYSGIHLLIVGKDEFNEQYHPVSLRMRLLSRIFGRNVFLVSLRKTHVVLFGEDPFSTVKTSIVGLADKLTTFILPFIILFIAPVTLLHRNSFLIWCFKAVKHHNEAISALCSITHEETYCSVDPHWNSLVALVRRYRYQPENYRGNRVIFYCRVWWALWRHLLYLFFKKKAKSIDAQVT